MKFNGGLHNAGKPEVLKTQFYLIQKTVYDGIMGKCDNFFMNINLKDFLKKYP